MNREMRSALLLFLTAAIWGFAMAFQREGSRYLGPFAFNACRFLLGGCAMLPLMLRENKKQQSPLKKSDVLPGVILGAILFLASLLQQAAVGEAGAGKAGFLTALYVVLVPVAGWLLLGKRPGKAIWAGVGLAVAALYLLCVPAGGFRVERGDAMLLGCAVCFTGQILCVDAYAPKTDALRLARDEFLVTGALSTAIALCTEEIRPEGILAAAVPVLYAGILSGAVGYTLQIIGQRDVNPTVASLLMCLESVFAVLTGALLLGERMTGREALGSVLMFSAVILAQLSTAVLGRRAEEGET